MITAKQEPLADGAREELKKWLAQGAFSTLIKIIEHRGKTAIVAAIGPAFESKDHLGKLLESNSHLTKAHRYAICLEVLEEIRNEQDQLTTVKLS